MSENPQNIEQLKRSIKCGLQSPYDSDENGEMPKPLTPERTAAYGILDNLKDRGGIGDILENIDQDIREEIVDALAGIIKIAIDADQ